MSENRPVMLVCGKCGNHDLDSTALIEIDFKKGQMTYVCRECNNENMMSFKSVPSSFPSIRVGK